MIKITKKAIITLVIIINIFIYNLPCLARTDPARNEGEKKILLLHSYSESYSWSQNIDRGVKDYLKEENIEVYTEWMGTKRIANEIHFKNLYELYKYKYKNNNFDLIISSDNNALNFLLKYREDLFPGTPVVFCGVNNFKPDVLSNHKFYYGLEEILEMKETIKIALKFHPQVSSLAAFFPDNVTGKNNRQLFKQALTDLNLKIPGLIYEVNNLKEVKEKISDFDPDTVIFLGAVIRSESGKVISIEKAVKTLAEATQLPIYGFWDFQLESGVVGGKVIRGYCEGQRAAELALEVLAGKVKDKTVFGNSRGEYMFDYQELKRLKVSSSELPANSVIVNKPTSFYFKHKRVIWSGIIIISIVVLFMLILLYYVIKYRRIKEQLETSEEQLRFAVWGSNLGIWDWNIKTGEVQFDAQGAKILGYGLEKIKETYNNWLRRVHPDDVKGVNEELTAHFEGESDYYAAEYRIKTENENWRWILDKGEIVEWDREGNPIRAVGTCQDINKRKRLEKKLKEYATYDSLTGVYNRRMGFIILKEKKKITDREQKRLTVCFIDVNNLKVVNDNYGHKTGDELLKKVVEVIEEQTREVDVLVRMGGDEFLIIFPNCSQKGAEGIWERINRQFKEINAEKKRQYELSVSYGLAEYIPREDKSIEDLVSEADKEMYKKKREMKKPT